MWLETPGWTGQRPWAFYKYDLNCDDRETLFRKIGTGLNHEGKEIDIYECEFDYLLRKDFLRKGEQPSRRYYSIKDVQQKQLDSFYEKENEENLKNSKHKKKKAKLILLQNKK